MGAIRPLKTVVTIVSVVVLAMAATAFWVSRTKPIPRSTKLVDCTNATLRFSFSVPAGDSYNFALGFGGVKNLIDLKPDYRGKLQITDGQKEVFNLDFESQQSALALWLRREEEIAGFTFTLPRREGQQSLDSVLTPGRNYQVTVIFSNPPRDGSSFWLKWRQSRVEATR